MKIYWVWHMTSCTSPRAVRSLAGARPVHTQMPRLMSESTQVVRQGGWGANGQNSVQPGGREGPGRRARAASVDGIREVGRRQSNEGNPNGLSSIDRSYQFSMNRWPPISASDLVSGHVPFSCAASAPLPPAGAPLLTIPLSSPTHHFYGPSTGARHGSSQDPPL